MAISVLKSGDVVRLKSGGPSMTVSIATDDKIECSWFFDGNIHHSTFTPDTLKTFRGKNADKLLAENEEA